VAFLPNEMAASSCGCDCAAVMEKLSKGNQVEKDKRKRETAKLTL